MVLVQEPVIKTGDPFLKNLKLIIRPEKKFVKIILVNSIAITFFSLFLPIAIQAVISNIGILNLNQPIIVMSIVMFVILGFSGVVQVLQFATIETLKQRLFIRFSAEIQDRITRYREFELQRAQPAQLSKRQIDILFAQITMNIFLVDGIGFLIQYIISMALLCVYHPFFLFFSLFITFLLVLSWVFYGPKGVAAGTPEADTKYTCMAWIDETLRARPLFMSNLGRAYAQKKLIGFLDDWCEKRDILYYEKLKQVIFLYLINAVVYTLLIALGFYLIKNGELSVGQLVAATLVVIMLLSSLPRLQNFFMSIYDYSTNIDKIAEFYSHPIEEQKPGVKNLREFDNFSLEYNDVVMPSDIGIDFQIQAGEKVFIFQESFATAKCLVQLLQGFDRPLSGEIRIADVRSGEIDYNELRDQIVIIEEDRFINASIKDNLILGATREISDTEIYDILQKVGLAGDVQKLPEKLDTEIDPNGFPFSKSEILALQVARVALLNPKLVVFTADIEKMSQVKKECALEILLKSNSTWTLLILSQRPIFRDFDQYLALNRGQTVSYNDMRSIF